MPHKAPALLAWGLYFCNCTFWVVCAHQCIQPSRSVIVVIISADHGKDPIVAEKSLMHATGSAVVQAYQRSDLLDARRVLMQEWADAVYPEQV